MIFGPLFIILTLAAVIACVILLLRSRGGLWPGAAPSPPAQSSRALDTLKERFARGEIDKTEYEERRRVLGE